MIRLYDGREKNFEIIGDAKQICEYMGYDMVIDDIHSFHDLDRRIENDNKGMKFYHVEEI
jgi:hypothetical protein